MHLNSLFLVMQLVFTIGVRNGLAQDVDIDGYPVPDPCANICTPAATLTDYCFAGNVSCLCTSGSDTEIQECVNCVIPLVVLTSSLGYILEAYRDAFNSLCSSLPPITFPLTTSTSASFGTTSTDLVTSPAATPVSAASQTPQITETILPSTTSQVIPSTSTSVLPTNNGNSAESATSTPTVASGAIVGGVVGGIAIIVAGALIAFLLFLRHHKHLESTPFTNTAPGTIMSGTGLG